MEVEQYWQAIQGKICPRCLDGDGKGNCRLPAGEECAVQSFLPQIITAIKNVHSTSMGVYISALRGYVCSFCEHQSTDDLNCKKRNHLECALDRYYPLVVETIESVKLMKPYS